MTAGENVMVGCQAHQRRGFAAAMLRLPSSAREDRDAREEAGRLLRLIGIEEWLDTPAADLPAGIRRLVEIARALATGPRLLLLDEPAAGLNASETPELVADARRMRDGGVTVVIVEHDMGLVMEVSDEIVVLDRGAQDRRGPAAADPEGPRRHRRLPGRGGRRCLKPPRCSSCRDVRAGYGRVAVLTDVDMAVGAGELVAVIGANGAGKSHAAQDDRRARTPPRAGVMRYDGADARAGHGPSAACGAGSRSCRRAGCSSAP